MVDNKLSRKAFDRKIGAIINNATALETSSIKGAIALLNDLRKQIGEQIKLAEGWDASFLPRIQNEINIRINRFADKLIAQMNVNQAEAFRMGQTIVDGPLSVAKIEIGLPLLSDELLQVAAAFTADLITNASQEAIEQITSQLNQSILGLETQTQTIEKIDKKIFQIKNRKGLSARAERIVRTEVPRVFSIATQARLNQAKEDVPDLMKRWRTLGDLRVRGFGEDRKTPRSISTGIVDHREADGQLVGVNEPFIVSGEELQFPRDPAGSPENVIRCRCYEIPELGRFQEDKENPGG